MKKASTPVEAFLPLPEISILFQCIDKMCFYGDEELQPTNHLVLKEKGDISVALSTSAPLSCQSCSQVTSSDFYSFTIFLVTIPSL
jgi:hypothetical protein